MHADIVFTNGEVITVDKDCSIMEAVAIKDHTIIGVGQMEEVGEFIGENTKVIDLEGKSLLPGFIDPHLHLTIYGTNLLGINCASVEIDSLEILYEKMKERAEQTPKGEWIRVTSFNENAVKQKRFPTIQELDAISAEHPIVIIRVCNHTSIVNSKALELAGITSKSENPAGGEIERDVHGELTGKMIENAHMQLFNVADYSADEIKKGLKLASQIFVESGITSLHDAGSYGWGPDILKLMKTSIDSGDVKNRVYALIGSLTDSESFIRHMIDEGVVTGDGDEWFKIGPAKLFTDGSSTGPTLSTRKPYDSDPTDTGILYYDQERMNEILGEAHSKGYQITAHAQGDRAIEMVLNCIEEALEKHPRTDHRHRIEHAGIASIDLQERMKELGVVVIPNPAFMYVNGDSYLEFYGDRVHVMYPANDYLEKGIPFAFASDTPVVDHNPLLGIHAAVNRKTISGQDAGTYQRVSVLEAIKAYTYMGAYASFDEKQKGSIEVGKLADLVVLDQSILSVDSESIKDLTVELTMIDGKIAYEKQYSNRK
ncbi:amidohydrolase [Sporosarcina sp. P16b]|uniref:amidohydrolase n=1 Tax=Sporosarcina sp. P16b TaxID=2048261 RepID=UPI000C163D82|nr:amidohydrolase [Sporosarcina sp. P16b]PIC70872.1 amidohydrolase [Sporosarcina sp. P16b]